MSFRGTKRLSTKKKFVADGVFYSELNEFLTSELAEDGYAGVEVRTTPHRTELIIRATRPQNVIGENNRRIHELTSAVQKRFNFADGAVELYADRVQNRGLCAQAQAESLKFKLLGGLAVRRACYGVVRFVMEASAKGCEVIVTGKLRGQRAKGMKFGDGYMIKTGHAGQVYTDTAVRHVLMRQGVIGIKVSIFLPQDPKGIIGPKIPLDDVVTILEPKEEISPAAILAAQAQAAAAYAAAQAQAAAAAASMEQSPVDGDDMIASEDPQVDAGF
jgi:small subunit ribosomal protein S3e